MLREPSPITQMLAHQVRDVKLLIHEIKEKIDNLDLDEVVEKKKPK